MSRRPKLSAPATDLPEELILEILSRLPAKSVIRCKCVCKPWYNSISDPIFVKMHLNRATQLGHVNLFLSSELSYPHRRTSVYCLEGDTSSFDSCVQIENPFDFFFDHSTVMGSCNGLVCLGNKKLICLLNPFTREYKSVRFREEFVFGSKTVYGLGYDDAKDDYIILQVIFSYANGDFRDSRYESEVNVYSLNDSSCSKMNNIPYKISPQHDLGVYLNGCLHWVAERKCFTPSAMIFYCIKEKGFREMPLPVNLRAEDSFTLGELGGNVCVLCDVLASDTELWVMKTHGVAESWMKLFSLKQSFILRSPFLRVLCFSENGKILLMGQKEQYLYHPKLDRLWNVKYRNVSWQKMSRSVIYVASLVSLQSGTYVGDVAGAKPAKKRKTRARWLCSDSCGRCSRSNRNWNIGAAVGEFYEGTV